MVTTQLDIVEVNIRIRLRLVQGWISGRKKINKEEKNFLYQKIDLNEDTYSTVSEEKGDENKTTKNVRRIKSKGRGLLWRQLLSTNVQEKLS